jgi:hypothetical protein
MYVYVYTYIYMYIYIYVHIYTELKAAERLEFKTGDQIKADAIGLPKIGMISFEYCVYN